MPGCVVCACVVGVQVVEIKKEMKWDEEEELHQELLQKKLEEQAAAASSSDEEGAVRPRVVPWLLVEEGEELLSGFVTSSCQESAYEDHRVQHSSHPTPAKRRKVTADPLTQLMPQPQCPVTPPPSALHGNCLTYPLPQHKRKGSAHQQNCWTNNHFHHTVTSPSTTTPFNYPLQQHCQPPALPMSRCKLTKRF